MKKSILILYTSSGYGHKKIAENFAAVLGTEHDVDLKDIFEVQKGVLSEWGPRIYLKLLKYIPGLWGFFYTNPIFQKVLQLVNPLRIKIAGKNSGKVVEALQQKHYDIIITTQTSASAIVSYLKSHGIFQGKFVITFTDFHLHKYWLYENADMYLANIEEQKEEMLELGIPENKIAICGVTVIPKQVPLPSEIRAKYGVGDNEKVVLYLGGGRGLGIEPNVLAELRGIEGRVIVVCGKNEELRAELDQMFSGDNKIHVLGYVDGLDELYSIADLVISKPGGMSVVEALYYRLPILVSSYIPGQEKLNYDYLAERSLIMPDFVDVRGSVEDELKTGDFRKDLMNNPEVNKIVSDGSTVKQVIDQM
jgi:processive 1,2-diacylglycerol beta-glucosyltransferase